MMKQNLADWEKIKENLKKELQTRGLRLSLADLSGFVEELSPSWGQKALGFALDFAKPFVAGIGLRVARWSDTSVEIIVPLKTKNKNESGTLHHGVLVTGAIECVQLLWSRHLPLTYENWSLQNFHIDFLRPAEGDVFIRYELLESEREKILFQARVNQSVSIEAPIHLFDSNGQLIAEAKASLSLQQRVAIPSQS
ncbi:MAG: PaaI family thioesterase [Pseudobdellovibrionaceae bacterium]